MGDRCSSYSDNCPMVECGACKKTFCAACSEGAGTTCHRLLFEELEGEEICLQFTCRACVPSVKRCAEGVCACTCVRVCVSQTSAHAITCAHTHAHAHIHTQ